MRRIFLDTAGLVALWDESDQWHELATLAYEEILKFPFIAITSPQVLLECANAASRRPYREYVCVLRRALAKDDQIITPGTLETEAAWNLYRTGNSGSASVVDLLSFSIMRRLGITEAFTNDKHFKVEGFTTLF
jgi:predicted nucleic acid-binding protein